ncbi:MAG: DUF423 domain-containing protein [Cytophagaceae bacterium]|nr:DUF423 domain-containing protein [Cytophagaceae bacterium]MDW8457216.1 DUF423 domain-containing protein [Cytophagaceae bacterium]
MGKIFLFTGSILGMLGVAVGAFGAHGLQKILLAHNRVETFETAVKYHFYHGLALLVLGLFLYIKPTNLYLIWSGYLFIAGVIIFSGSLYILSLTNVKWWGAVTPVGGIVFILGWLFLAWGCLKSSTG